MKSIILAGALALTTSLATLASADQGPVDRRVYQTLRAVTAPTIDGTLDDAAWSMVEWSGDFTQREPTEGVPPTKPTQFKVVYDDQALYLGFRAYDDPEQMSRLLARRDRFPGDWVEVNIDSYYDHRTAFSFTLSLSGTRGDEFVSNDGDRWDGNWDPIWQGATHIDGEGWTAEMRIPLSQLRFSADDKQTWGLQVQRRIFRQEERSTWQRIPKGTNGWVSQFGELRGIDGVKPRRRVELLPYTVARADRFEKEAGNPFLDGSSSNLTGGLDGKVGVTSNLTLDFTLNPDFGQVEADPSEVNLTAFETFFEEKRPFFIEGNDIVDLRVAPAITGGHFTQDRLFYSRRIGGRPPHSPDLGDQEFAEEPDTSSILGAFKLSGKTAGGLSVGILESLTAHERAEIDLGGTRRFEDVAPLTNYFVGRVRQDWRGGDTQLGAMLTNVHRSIDAPVLEFLPTTAWSGGLDLSHYFSKRGSRLEGSLLFSRLQGSPTAIEEAQLDSARYFQRPDNDHAHLDATRTSLDGVAGSVRFTRAAGNSPFRMQTGVAFRSPGFEINDIGFMNRADEINQFTWAAYQIRNPKGPFNRVEMNVNQWLDWDTGGHLLRKSFNTNQHFTFRNMWRVGFSLNRQLAGVSNTELRGGPSSRWPGQWFGEIYMQGDQRKKLQVAAGYYTKRGDEGSLTFKNPWMDVIWRPANALTVTMSPQLIWNRPELQYVDTVSFDGQDRYIFGRLDQKTSMLTLRLDFAITPSLTVQYYGAPFVSSGRYLDLKRITAPRADAYRDRFQTFTAGQTTLADDVYSIDENGDGRVDYTLDRPDFDFRQFNSTLVARWEYKPGSSVYLVWSQGRLDETMRVERASFGRGLSQLFDSTPHDVFLIKFSKWFSL